MLLLATILFATVGSPGDRGAGGYWDDGSVIYLDGRCETYMQTSNIHWGISRDECAGMAAMDKRLNAAYRKRIASFHGESKTAFRKSQREWISQRNSKCHLVEPIKILDGAASSCFMDETERRVTILEGRKAPIAPGLYCLKEPMTGYTGTGHDIPLGDFLMSVEVARNGGRYEVSIGNQMPDNSQMLEASTGNASVLRDGSLAFSFTDGWENEGRARVYPNGQVVLAMTKKSDTPMNQIGRNYGTFTVGKVGCLSDEFRQFR